MWSKILKSDKWFHLLEPFMNETKNAIDDLFYSNISLPVRSTINTVQIMKGSHMLEWGGKITNEFGIRFWIMWILEHNQKWHKASMAAISSGSLCVIHTDSQPKVKNDRFIFNRNSTNWDSKVQFNQMGCAEHSNAPLPVDWLLQ